MSTHCLSSERGSSESGGQTGGVSSASAAASLLFDPARLQVAGALVGITRSSADIAQHTGLESREVLQAIADLRAGDLVQAAGDGYTIDPATLRELAAAAAEAELPMDPAIGYGMTEAEQQVLVRYFSGRVLTELPTARAKRLVVLERLALEFDVGRRYTEEEVNATLHPFNTDVAMLRRYLVDEGLLDRDHGEYWRSGGRLD